MVVLAFIGDAEPDHYLVQEFRFGQYFPNGRKIVPRVKDQLVFTGPKLIFRQQGLITAPVIVGHRAAKMVVTVVDPVQLDPDTGGRAPVSGIQYMRGKKSHWSP